MLLLVEPFGEVMEVPNIRSSSWMITLDTFGVTLSQIKLVSSSSC
jgi:hypothetical protein